MIDKERLKENLISFSFPRLSGSVGEIKACEMAKSKIEKLDLTPNVQQFEFSTFYSRIYPKLGFTSVSSLLFIFYLNIASILFAIIISLILIIMLLCFLFTRKPHKIRFGKILKSYNIYVRLPEKDHANVSEKKILFFCHLDSKSQKITILVRINAIRLWLYSTTILSIIIVLKNYIFLHFTFQLYIVGIFPLVLNLISMSILLLNTTGDKSMGAIDNASGIAIVLELLSYYKADKNRSKNYEMWFVFTGAEESGTMGIRFFNEIIKNFDRKNSLIINFDAIAQSVCLFASKRTRKRNTDFFEKFIREGQKLKMIREIRYKTLGAHSDGYYLKTQKFMGAGFGDLLTYQYVHSDKDTPDKVDFSILKGLCELITRVLN